MQPIRPDEVQCEIPDGVIEAFNDLIRDAWNGREAVFSLQAALRAASAKTGLGHDLLLEKHSLDVEHLYRAVGWIVEFHKPTYNEPGEPWFTFRKVER